jgi:pilus assembly protein CpaC
VNGSITRIAVGDPDVADARPVGQDQVLVTGGKEGRTNLLVWRTGGARVSFQIVVRRVSAEETIGEIRSLLGEREGIVLRAVGDRVFLDGEAYTASDLQRVEEITRLYPAVRSLVRVSPEARRLLARDLTASFAAAGMAGVSAGVIGTTMFLEGSVESEQDLKKVALLSRVGGEEVENLVTVGIRRMVLSEVQFLEVRRADALAAGIRWPLEFSGNLTGTATWTLPQHATSAQVVGTAGTAFSFRFGQDSGLGRLLAKPRLLCASGEEAEFLAGGEVPVPMISAQSSRVEYKPYGIILRLRPTADRAGNVVAVIEAEVSEVDRSVAVAVGPDQSVPGFRNRRVRTSVTVKDGETIVLSGVLSQDEQKSVSRTPVLGHVPLLGELFKQRDITSSERELVIFVTPRVVTPDSERVRELVQGMKRRWIEAGGTVSFGLMD